ncbi:TIGR03986 family CRISPR-associated RAMP protein [Synechococcales cyanobacterium C]|uniref:TIGR03986 family CRISPR-associated RAMP protein n=1 Tax=Petrachloros mirabilis ULC683 TaxID=2781853 RepID=A0A8K2A1Z6_9CYAN|nr:TIGR03986 family CRISPR-associated RAMP protein [Petrachloros mirabilis]NCJ08017.1 TIGR03986 family CRISPR-associated RAMP protein [Petrachloros mirabilis ULC683]
MITGRLEVSGSPNNRKLRVTYTHNGSYNQITLPNDDQLSLALAAKKQEGGLEALKNLPVELEEDGGQPVRIREQGQDWDRVAAAPIAPVAAAPADPFATVEVYQAPNLPPGDFHNPYNFIPAPPRQTEHPDLGDHNPVKQGMGHGYYHPDRWSGRIAVKLTTETPLLIPDAANATGDDHKSYPLRLGVDGKPYLPPTSIKGMLRTAYEAVTNSRFAIFAKHEERLAYRMPANLGLKMVPARIEKDATGNLIIQLYPGTSTIGADGAPGGNQMYAAWLPSYQPNGSGIRNLTGYPANNRLPNHRDRVTVLLEQYGKYHNPQHTGHPIFTYWKVRAMAPPGTTLDTPPPGAANGRHAPLRTPMRQVDGYVCITNKNIDNKHDERVFFSTAPVPPRPLTPALQQQWQALIKNYQEIHETEISRGMTGPPALANSRWSRQVVGGSSEWVLSPGTLCYAQVKKVASGYDVLALYPVMISRELYAQPPQALLHPSQAPAERLEQLSPADRVFGWVNQQGKSAYKGNLRIHSVTCHSDTAVASFNGLGVPLAILGAPKPEQTRFYTAHDATGNPLQVGVNKESGYDSAARGLRGRKVYPHHNGLPANHWDNPQQDRTHQDNQGHYQEYRRPRQNGQEQRDDQNRSIQAWVKPQTEFSLQLEVTNLSKCELGALLWLLTLPPGHYHRLGGAKPFGFGSVYLQVDWQNTDLKLGQGWKTFYQSLTAPSNADPFDPSSMITAFKDAVQKVQGGNFEQVPFIAAFCRAAQGFADQLPVHYPRLQAQLQPDTKIFDWFVANERTGNQGNGQKVSLPALRQDQGLPLNPLQ